MTETNSSRWWLRSIGAVLVGIIFVVVTHTGADAVMHATGVFPPRGQPMSDALFVLATIYRTALCVAGSYLTARMAPHRPMLHALIGGAIGLVISSVAAVATWNAGPEFGPHWYPIALAAIALPTAWLGGKIHEQQTKNQKGETQ